MRWGGYVICYGSLSTLMDLYLYTALLTVCQKEREKEIDRLRERERVKKANKKESQTGRQTDTENVKVEDRNKKY